MAFVKRSGRSLRFLRGRRRAFFIRTDVASKVTFIINGTGWTERNDLVVVTAEVVAYPCPSPPSPVATEWLLTSISDERRRPGSTPYRNRSQFPLLCRRFINFLRPFLFFCTMTSSNLTSPACFERMMSAPVQGAPGSSKWCQGSSNKTELFSLSPSLLLRGRGELSPLNDFLF